MGKLPRENRGCACTARHRVTKYSISLLISRLFENGNCYVRILLSCPEGAAFSHSGPIGPPQPQWPKRATLSHSWPERDSSATAVKKSTLLALQPCPSPSRFFPHLLSIFFELLATLHSALCLCNFLWLYLATPTPTPTATLQLFGVLPSALYFSVFEQPVSLLFLLFSQL